MSGITVRRLEAGEAAAGLDALAQLRIEVFRAFPYLYDGDLDYERRYLAAYAEGEGAVIIGAFDGDRLVGAATGSPLAGHHAEFARPFAAHGLDIGDFFYFGESVLLPACRGRGIGHRFFEEREEAARAQGFAKATFCAVERPPDHPARPPDYAPLDSFWERRGYWKVPGLKASFSWRDIGEAEESEKPMQFWARDLPVAACS